MRSAATATSAQYDYSRSGNPTRDLLGNALADLEGGAGGVITGTGMSAITLVGHLLPQGARIVAPHDCYGGTFRLFTAWNKRNELKVDFVRFDDAAELDAALSQKTDLLWIETPSNPLLRITDIAALVQKVKGRGTLVAVDNTFLSPAWQRPLELGADIVVHSTTKYINGHSDWWAARWSRRRRKLHDQLAWWANALGLTGGAFDSFLTLRGLRTLRSAAGRARTPMRSSSPSGCKAQKGVRKVYFPGLPDHPGHESRSASRAASAPSSRSNSKGGTEAVKRFVEGLRVSSRSPSHSAAWRAWSRIRLR